MRNSTLIIIAIHLAAAFALLGYNNTSVKEAPRAGMSTSQEYLVRSESTQAYILDTIRANPDAVLDALKIIQAREMRSAQSEDQSIYDEADASDSYYEIENSDNVYIAGNPDADVTIVQFFDYNCGFCKQAAPVIASALQSDNNIRVIYREFPILTEVSSYAAKASLASRSQGKFEEFHAALMDSNGPLEEFSVLKIAQEVGLDVDVLTRDMQDQSVYEHLRASQDIADFYGIKGTPTFSVNGVIHEGAPSKATLSRVIKEARMSEHE